MRCASYSVRKINRVQVLASRARNFSRTIFIQGFFPFRRSDIAVKVQALFLSTGMTILDAVAASTGSAPLLALITHRGNVALFQDDLLSLQEPIVTTDTLGNPFPVPDYTIKQILSAIPKHCYVRLLPWSLHYVARDIIAMFFVGWVSHRFIPLVNFESYPNVSAVARGLLWALDSYVIGLFGFGLWILAHECGHGAFSDYSKVNDFVGWALHSYLVVPYFSWKHTHSKHHKATGHMTKDTVFIPFTKEEYAHSKGALKISDIMEELPVYSLVKLVLQQLGGLQLHLITNATGQSHPGYTRLGKSHYNPAAPIFDKGQAKYVLYSDIGILLVFAGLYQWYKALGLFTVMINWFVPWCWVNHWLVFVTFLQHTDSTMPHYHALQWTFARGAAATIDRNFGFVGQHIFHDIIETHVLHHYVSRIPFYNAREASHAIQQVMGKHYRYEGENMWKSLWKNIRMCQFVDDADHKGVYMFRNTNKIGVKPRD